LPKRLSEARRNGLVAVVANGNALAMAAARSVLFLDAVAAIEYLAR
jgi:hypothetical protein